MSATVGAGATWGHGPFDNDEAMDLLVDVLKAFDGERARKIRAALALPARTLPPTQARQAVAAAALVAAANGMGSLQPPELAHLVKAGGIPSDEQTLAQARAALARIAGPAGGPGQSAAGGELPDEARRVFEEITDHL